MRSRLGRRRRPTCPLLGIDTGPPPEPVIAPPSLTFPGTYIDIVDEVRVGVFAHNWIHDESAPVDASVELLSSALPLPGPADNPWFGWFFRPRINVGGMINTGGKTSYAFTGLTCGSPSTGGFFSKASSAAPSTMARIIPR